MEHHHTTHDLIVVMIPDLAMAANNLDDLTLDARQNPLRLGNRIPDRRTNRWALPIAAARDLLRIASDCPSLDPGLTDDGGRERRACRLLVQRLEDELAAAEFARQEAEERAERWDELPPGPWILDRGDGELPLYVLAPEAAEGDRMIAALAPSAHLEQNARALLFAKDLLQVAKRASVTGPCDCRSDEPGQCLCCHASELIRKMKRTEVPGV